MTREEEVSLAEELGKEAFKKGEMRVPAFDKKLMGLIGGKRAGESIPALKAWVRGWDSENLKS